MGRCAELSEVSGFILESGAAFRRQGERRQVLGAASILRFFRGVDDATRNIDAIVADEWDSLVEWLDDGLRRGMRGTLQAEYALSLRPDHFANHRVVRSIEGFAAHAMFHRVVARVGETRLPMGLIGLVYTDPKARGRGLGSQVVAACVEAIKDQGIPLAVLWSDRPDFYARQDFHPAGREELLVMDERCIRDAGRRLAAPGTGIEVRGVARDDFEALEPLYASKRSRAERAAGALARQAAGPGVHMRVAQREGRVRGYAAMGRGDDFQGIVHEWAGETAAVLACLGDLARDRPALGMLAGPDADPLLDALRAAGAGSHSSSFALIRLLDSTLLLQAVIAGEDEAAKILTRQEGTRVVWQGERGQAETDTRQTLSLLLAGEGLDRLSQALTPAEFEALSHSVPWPLHVWGFDSI